MECLSDDSKPDLILLKSEETNAVHNKQRRNRADTLQIRPTERVHFNLVVDDHLNFNSHRSKKSEVQSEVEMLS